MSTVNLVKSIVRRRFSVPVKSSVLHEHISKQLKLVEEAWCTAVKHPRSGTFHIDWGIMWTRFSLANEGSPFTKDNIRKKLVEYDKKILKYRGVIIFQMVRSQPCEIHYVVTEEMIDRCVCEATCFPVLFLGKARYKIPKMKCDETDIRLARQQCEEFLVDIFVGGLGGKEIIERKAVSPLELLINDVDYRQITDCINLMLQQATGEVLLMGWVGTDCLPKLKELKNQGVTIQAVTHKPSEMKASVPKDIQQGFTNLIKILGETNVSINRELHGRAIIVDNKTLIGSMDFNSFSLSGEHREFAVYTEDIDTVRKLRAYFKRIFVPLKKG